MFPISYPKARPNPIFGLALCVFGKKKLGAEMGSLIGSLNVPPDPAIDPLWRKGRSGAEVQLNHSREG